MEAHVDTIRGKVYSMIVEGRFINRKPRDRRNSVDGVEYCLSR